MGKSVRNVMNRHLRTAGFSVFVLIALLMTGCNGQPNWCNEKLTSYTNYEYGYKLYYPPDADLITREEGHVSVLIHDEVSIIRVSIYATSTSPSERADSFIEKIEARNEIGEGGDSEYFADYPQRWNYEIEMNSRTSDFTEITYTYLKKDIVDIDPVKIKTISVRGKIYWYKLKYGGNDYIYCFQYETYANYKQCHRLLDFVALEFYEYLYETRKQ